MIWKKEKPMYEKVLANRDNTAENANKLGHAPKITASKLKREEWNGFLGKSESGLRFILNILEYCAAN